MTDLGRWRWVVVATTMWASLAAGAQAGDADPCAAFSWDVGHERALFAGTPEAITAGASVDSAPLLASERLYRLTLVPEDHVAFAVAPERKRAASAADAGLARLHIAAAGTYRVALSDRFWIDIVQGGKVISSSGFTGSHGCNAPHKVVAYTLAAGDYVLQISGLSAADVEISLTAAPTPAH